MNEITVVLDFDEYGGYPEGIVVHLREMSDSCKLGGRCDLGHWLADTIEAQLPKPKPDEPTGLGAVVRDRRNRAWVRSGRNPEPWSWWDSQVEDYMQLHYAAIDAVEVLSEGVTP